MKYCKKCKHTYDDAQQACTECRKPQPLYPIDDRNTPVFLIAAGGFEAQRIHSALESAGIPSECAARKNNISADVVTGTDPNDKDILVPFSAYQEAYQIFSETYPKLIQKVYELNPECTVVAVGLYNPFRYLRINEGSDATLGAAMEGLVNQFNDLIRNLNGYANNSAYDYRYADASNAEITPFNDTLSGYLSRNAQQELLDEFNLKMHCNRNGHRYIASQVLAALGVGKSRAYVLKETCMKKIAKYFADKGIALNDPLAARALLAACESALTPETLKKLGK